MNVKFVSCSEGQEEKNRNGRNETTKETHKKKKCKRRDKMKKREWIKKGVQAAAILLAVVIVSGTVIGIKNKPGQYHVTRLETGDLERTLTASGDVKTEESRTYYSTVDAFIKSLELKEGTEIAEGELLVEYDLEDLTREQKEAALRVQQADSSYQSTVLQNEKNTLLYQGAVITETMFCEMISEQWELISNLEKKIARAEVKANDINWLTSRAALDTDEDDRDDFAAGIDAWRKEYDSMGVPELKAELAREQAIYSDMQAFRAQYASQKENADARLIDTSAQQELQLKKQEAALLNEDAKSELSDAQAGILSGFHGLVRQRFVESGAFVTEGTPLFVVDNLDTLYVEAEISKYDIGEVKIGQKAGIWIGDRYYEGEVTEMERIALQEDSDKAKIPVHITFLGDDSDVCLGIEADVEIMLEMQKDRPLLDKRAVYEDENGNYVYRIADGKIERQEVLLGKENEVWCEVLEGITVEDAVILDAVTDSAIGKAAEEKESVQ